MVGRDQMTALVLRCGRIGVVAVGVQLLAFGRDIRIEPEVVLAGVVPRIVLRVAAEPNGAVFVAVQPKREADMVHTVDGIFRRPRWPSGEQEQKNAGVDPRHIVKSSSDAVR